MLNCSGFFKHSGMKTVLVQQDIVWADPSANREHLDSILAGIGSADLVVLPEMFSTGFATCPEGIAEEAPVPKSLDWMKAAAARGSYAIAGSVAVHEGGKYYNRLYFVKPDGSVVKYDKHHLFTYSGEDKTFAAGSERCIVEWRGVRFLLIVCYDLRFPVWIRNRADYDAIICVASWPTPRRAAWDTLVRARAIENQCWMLAVNRAGTDPSCTYSGGTALIDPYGAPVAAAADNHEDVISGTLDLDLLAAFRSKFPVLHDADSFEIK